MYGPEIPLSTRTPTYTYKRTKHTYTHTPTTLSPILSEAYFPLYSAVMHNQSTYPPLARLATIVTRVGSGLGRGLGQDGWTPLHWASGCGHLEVVKYLVEAGANLEVHPSVGGVVVVFVVGVFSTLPHSIITSTN